MLIYPSLLRVLEVTLSIAFLSLDQTFFGLTTDSKPYLLNEYYIATKHIGFTRVDVMNMPVWERRNYIQQLMEEVDEEKKHMEQQSRASSSGGGNRTRRVST